MRASAIRHLAITDSSSIVAAALFDKTVQIWCWKSGEQLGEFPTVLDFGGHRLALTPDGRTCIAGAWGQPGRGPRGLAAYSIPDGKLLWNRSDIRRIQFVRLSGSGREVNCGIEDSPAHIISVATGESIGRIRSAKKVFSSQYTSHELVVEKRRYLVQRGSEFTIAPLSFGVMDAAFSPRLLCLSEPINASCSEVQIGGVRLIELVSGKTRHFSKTHALRVAYNSTDDRFYGLSKEHGSHSISLVRFLSDRADTEEILRIEQCWDAGFSPSGRVLVTVHGDVFETATGAQLSHLNFPTREYPDE